MAHLVTDIEIRFRSGAEPVFFTFDETRGDILDTPDNGDKVYRLVQPTGLEDVHIVPAGEACYVRHVTRREEDEAPPVHLPGGITVSGQIPLPPE